MVQKIRGSRQIQSGTITPAELEATAVTPGVYGDTSNVPVLTIDADGRITSASEVAVTGGAAVADGDKGDVTVSGSGAVWTVDNDVVTNAKAANMATDTIKGRATAATGDPEDLTALPFAYTGDVTRPADSNVQTIANDAVTNAKAADMATDTIKGRATAGTGDPEDLASLPFAFTGDVTRPADSNVQTLAAGSASVLNSGTLPAGRMPALTGEVTTSVGAVATTIANDAVTYAKMQNVSAADRLLGRGNGGGAGDVQEIALGTNLTMSGTTLNAGGTAVDSDAIHDNVAGEIAAITEKVTPVDADLIVIEDSAAANVKKRVQIGNLPGGGGGVTQAYVGYNTVGGSTEGTVAYRTYVKQIVLASAGLLASIDIYVRANTAGITPNIEAAVWDDVGGNPEHVIAFGGNGRSASGNVLLEKAGTVRDARWLSINIGTWLPAGTYWIGFAQNLAALLDIYYDGSGSDHYWTGPDLFMNDYGITSYGISSPTISSNRYSIRANIIN